MQISLFPLVSRMRRERRAGRRDRTDNKKANMHDGWVFESDKRREMGKKSGNSSDLYINPREKWNSSEPLEKTMLVVCKKYISIFDKQITIAFVLDT